MSSTRNIFRALVGAAASLLLAVSALGTDKVTLKNGKVLEGTIVREVEGAVWIQVTVGGISTEHMYGPSEIKAIEHDADSTPVTSDPVVAGGSSTPAATSGRKTPKAVVLSMGDNENGNMVGLYMTAEILHRAIPALEQELGTDHTGVVVLRVHSGGGYLFEIAKINDVIQNELKPLLRTVAWIETAISAAAMSSHGIEEIYFMTQGNYGACVAFAGSLDKPVEGFELQKVLAAAEKVSAQGGYNPLIMRAMQLQEPLSATVDENGEVKWYNDVTSGKIIVNRPTEILTFNAVSALKVKFSKGTADTTDDLKRLMGYQELEWVGKKVKNIPYPVSKAEAMQIDFRKQVKVDEAGINSYYDTYRREIQAAIEEQDVKERGKYVGKARQALDRIKNMIRNNPAFKTTVFGTPERWEEFLREQEKLLRNLVRK